MLGDPVGAVASRPPSWWGVEAWVGESGGRALFLDTHVTNAEACAFYRAIGSRELGVMLLKEL